MNWTLVLICIVIGLFLSITLFQELGKPEKKQTIRLPETNGSVCTKHMMRLP